jgi:hypothetical protein
MSLLEKNTPPRLMLSWFRWFCHPAFREDIEGDLLERYHNNTISYGKRKAKWIFIKEVLLLFRSAIIKGPQNQTQLKSFAMKKFNWLKLAAMHLLLVAIILVQFLPGPPNKIVLGMSILAQCAGFFGMVLVPIGVAWLTLEIVKLKTGNLYGRPSFYLAIAATVIITGLMALFLILAIFALHETLLTLLSLIPLLILFSKAIKGIKALKNDTAIQLNAAPVYLITIPLLAFATTLYLIEPVSAFSRNFAIKRSEPLIASIEDYKNKEGQYPESIDELKGAYLKKIPSPFIMGIPGGFRYNKINGSYSLSFSQWLDWGSLEEIVLYDKSNLHKRIHRLVAYDYRLDLHRVNGAFAIHHTGHEDWSYYRCD